MGTCAGVKNQKTMLARVECCHAWSDWPDSLSFSLQGQSQSHCHGKDPSHPQSVESSGYALSDLSGENLCLSAAANVIGRDARVLKVMAMLRVICDV